MPQKLSTQLRNQFTRFLKIAERKLNKKIRVNWNLEVDDFELNLNINHFTITIPLPFQRQGVWFINSNGIERPISSFYLKQEEKELSYCEFMRFLLTENLKKIDPKWPSNTPFLLRIAFQLGRGNPAFTITRCQGTINEFINKLPLHETIMKSWAMNNRLIILDPAFEVIADPNEKLEYQVKKNEDYFENGWTSIGLSESALSESNYLLKVDLRKTIPFGKYHNPQRNLFQTLGMKGEEVPVVTTKTALKLEQRGIARKGFNLLTAFVDIPLVFEDHILADNSLKNIVSYSERRFHCYSKPSVEVGDKLKEGDIIGINPDGSPVIFNVISDEARVENIIERKVNIGGETCNNWIVIVKLGRHLKTGVKFTNLHGNKGIASFKDLGVAINPKTGEELKLQMIVSGSSVKRRKNFGQILEAVTTAVYGTSKRIVLDDNYEIQTSVEEVLKKNGFPEEGCWIIKTPWGEFQAVVGWVFWGLLKDPEDNTWTTTDLKKRNSRGLLENGLKFSHIEIRSLITRFGPGNVIVKEIMRHANGIEDIKQFIKAIDSCRGNIPDNVPVVQPENIKTIDLRENILVDKKELKGTVCDPETFPFEFAIQLPVKLYTVVPKNPSEDVLITDKPTSSDSAEIFTFDKIFVPYFNLRKPWKHSNGKFGLNPTSNMINRILINAKDRNIPVMVRNLETYFNTITKTLSTKRGEIAQKGMGVRYPYSNRATAVLGENLPPNTIEIHTDFAKQIGVKHKEIVLVERFPCLGFMSLRPQQVFVTDDEDCRYVVKVSGNSLVSLNLDFDGDTLFLAGFFSNEAQELLRKEWTNPNKICWNIIKEMNSRKKPQFKEFLFQDYEIHAFDELDVETHAKLVRRAVGVKSHTGPVIALCYNLMRITEHAFGFRNTELNANIEKMLDKIGNSVFSQKHGVRSLQEECTEAICLADWKKLEQLGFDSKCSWLLSNLIKFRAAELGIMNLEEHYQRHKEAGRSNIINVIVRNLNKIYFASRANLAPPRFLKCLESEPVDLPSHMFRILLKHSKRNFQRELEIIFEESGK